MVAAKTTTVSDTCRTNLLHTKWLLAPSHRVGHQWIEALVRNGQSIVNLHPTTVLRLAIDLIGSELAENKLTLAGQSIGPLIVDATWHQLSPSGYLGRLERSADLSAAVYSSLLSLRLAGRSAGDLDASHLESATKAKDIVILLGAYEAFLKNHSLVDEADVLRRAIARLNADLNALGDNTVVLIPDGIPAGGLERHFLDALSPAVRLEVRHPADQAKPGDLATDIRLLANISETVDAVQPENDGSVQFYRAVGEINEVREVLRRCLSDGQQLDDVEVLHADTETYIPLIYATARRYFAELERPEGVPVTFAEGIPASMSRPGRALIAWLHWMREGYPQRLLVEMIGEGLLSCGDDELGFSYLAQLLRPLGIGVGSENYLPKIDEQIEAMQKLRSKRADDDADEAKSAEIRERRLKGLKALRKLVKLLLSCSQGVVSNSGSTMLDAAEKFLTVAARSVSELDRYAAEALVEQLQDRRLWLERLGVALDLEEWLVALPIQTRVLGSGPRPGHLHVSHVGSGGQSGRKRTFVLGLDDRRFPGAALQDPILLDRERINLSPELATSAAQLRHKINELAHTLSRLSGSVTLSWPCHHLTDDRETFPSSVALSAYRLVSGRHDADLETLNAAVGPPASFAPTAAEKALDESERWLWRLTDDAIKGTNQVHLVEARFPHLARGSAAQRSRLSGFGPHNGYVPQAGHALNPHAAEGPVLSASALETAGRCPLAFFFRNGLKVHPPEELEVDEDRWLDAAHFGQLLHEVFRQFMSELCGGSDRPQYERDHVRLAEILHSVVGQWRKDVPPPNENAFRMQYWQLVRTSRIFLQVEEEFCRTSQPRFFEVALGLESVADGSPLDQTEPTTVNLPNGRSIRARGQIDRVDEVGPNRYGIWDYKTGSGYGYAKSDPFRQGRRVQSVLYLQMVEMALRKKYDAKAVVERFGYLFPTIRANGLRVDWNSDTLIAGLGVLERLCASIEKGAFLPTDNKEDCQWCDYRSVCGDVDRVAAHSKAILDQTGLVPLQHFRELRRG